MGQRPPRTERVDGIAHVVARGNNRRPIFTDDEDRERYLLILGLVIYEFGWRCLAYCLMRNHIHLIVQTPRANLAHGMKAVHNDYARTFNERHGRINHLFGTRYHPTYIDEPEHLRYAATYVALNPVKAELCNRPQDWAWSSHGAVIGAVASPWWLSLDPLLAAFDGLGQSPVDAYARYVAAVAAAR